MAKPRMPAVSKQGKSETKEELAKRQEEELKLKGGTDKVFEVPRELKGTDRKYYKFLVTELANTDTLSNLDIPILIQTAKILTMIDSCDTEILQNGGSGIFMDNNNQPKEHPASKQKLAYMTQYRAMCGQLGLSPAARASLAGKKAEANEEANDPLAKLLSARNGGGN